jgi:pheromone a factor receptor
VGFPDASSLEHALNYPTATRIQVGLNVAIPASSLCINRHLYKVATAKGLLPAGAEKRRAVLIDLLIGLGIPILQLIVRECVQSFALNQSFYLHGFNTEYVVSGCRYLIFEDLGPLPATSNEVPSFFLV